MNLQDVLVREESLQGEAAVIRLDVSLAEVSVQDLLAMAMRASGSGDRVGTNGNLVIEREGISGDTDTDNYL